jgi:hypothetical protein
MPAQIIQRPSSHAPHYDAIEILMIAAGVLSLLSHSCSDVSAAPRVAFS